ncbi:YcgP [Lachnospiraceae bacterium TWA4]|nr:YcgP [Lachnospiraceae bacterium TWA4]
MLLLCNLDLLNLNDFQAELKRNLLESDSIAGASYLFQTISQCKDQKELAYLTTQYSERKKGMIYGCESYIFKYMTDVLQKHSKISLIHPVLEILKEYDLKSHSELYKTLWAFLECERDYKKTSKMLVVHRNTVQYRIDKIVELTGIDLEDVQTRIYLVVSFFMDQEN